MLTTDLNFANYQENSFKLKEINWWDLSKETKLKLDELPNDIKNLGSFITVRRLKLSNQENRITTKIVGIKKRMVGKDAIPLRFPIHLSNKEYAQLYALMISEGSHNTEFGINVPEAEFHDLFKNCIAKVISEEASQKIKIDFNKNVRRSRAPAVLRHLIPVPKMIPKVITDNREFSREYLKVAFEAEGSPIYDGKHKRYIKLTRYRDITLLASNENLPLADRVYSGTIKKNYPKLFKEIINYPPETLLGEHLLLRCHFNIDNKLVLEAIRNNTTGLRAGKITARWVLLIYANNIDKFIHEINFISNSKREKCEKMLKIKAQNPQYFAIQIIKNISRNFCFKRVEFVKEMKKRGYKSPSCYLWRYEKSKLIQRSGRGNYKLLVN